MKSFVLGLFAAAVVSVSGGVSTAQKKGGGDPEPLPYTKEQCELCRASTVTIKEDAYKTCQSYVTDVYAAHNKFAGMTARLYIYSTELQAKMTPAEWDNLIGCWFTVDGYDQTMFATYWISWGDGYYSKGGASLAAADVEFGKSNWNKCMEYLTSAATEFSTSKDGYYEAKLWTNTVNIDTEGVHQIMDLYVPR